MISSPIVPGVRINGEMLELMAVMREGNIIEDANVDKLFAEDTLPIVNRAVKGGNYYALDEYNLVIRKNAYNNKKIAFGWIYNEHRRPVNIHIDPMLITIKSKDIQTLTLQKLQRDFRPVFKEPSGVLYRVYSTKDLGCTVVEYNKDAAKIANDKLIKAKTKSKRTPAKKSTK